uniref:EGF-like domain-containing protein n=1 Tax=Plectus sambesii TaxID=2011161 RepID=A0A914WTE2_9BILA
MVMRRFDHLKRLAESVGWKPIVEPPEARLKVIESKARRQLQPKIEQNTQKDTGCPAGYTGVNCTSPICYNTSTIIYHDGTANMGDDIEWDLSSTCNDTTYYFPLDSFTNDITITILAAGDISPAGSLLGPKGEILPTSVLMNSAEKWQATFGSVVEQNGAGLYSFALRSEGIATCVFTVQAATVLSCDGGFVSDMRDDNVQVQVLTDNNGIERMPVEGVPSYLAFAVKNEIWPIQALSVVIYSGGLFAQVYPVSARYGCGAPNYAGAFTCTKGNFYHLKIRGIDTYGNVWQRVYYFICTPAGGLSTTLGPTGPTGPTTTLPTPTHCYNEGQLVNPDTSDAFCYCLPYFTGNMCQNKLCFNGGFLASDDECVCLDDWTGPYCTDAKCQTNTDIPFDLRFRALVFVVRTSTSMADEFTQIIQAARGITSFYTANHADYFAVYVLATFVNGTIPIVTQFTDPQAFIAALTGLTPSPGGCDDTVFTTLSTVLQLPALAQYQRSPIFVFTDGVTNDGRDQLENMFNLLSYWRGEIYTVLTDPADGCSIDTASQGYRDYQQIARFSQGLVSHVPKTAVATLVTALANNLYQMDHVLTNDLMINCQKAPVYQPFLVDTDTQAIVITATGTALSLMLTDPMMQKMSMTPILSQSGTYIWMTTNLTIGSYLLSISGASAPCQYRVMARSSLDLFFGMSSSLNSDAISPQPIYITITMNDPNDNRVALFASNGVYRDGCSYFLYFGNWRCQRPFDEFYITVYGMDNDGATFQRVATGFCSAKLPPVVPPNGCLNGGVDGPNGTCVCPPYFSGPLCQTIQCLNGGTPTSGFCFCPPGFTSQFCELTMCFQINQEDPFSPNERSLTYIIHDSLRMRALIQGLQQTAAQLTQSISQQHPRWINFYQLISFNDQGYKVYTESASPSDFVAGLGALLADNKQNISVSCRNLSMFEPINYALSSLHASRNGHVFVFTCGQAAMNYETIAEMFDKVYESRTQINFIQTDSRPCGLHMNDSGIGIQMEIPLLTGGQFFPVSTIKAAQINSYVPTLYSGNLVYENSISDCTKPQSFYFPIDSHTQAFTVYTQGQLVNTGSVINSPQGTPYTSSNIINLWSDTTLNTRVDQVIRACDPSWEDVVSDGNCYKFNFKQLTWTQARDACHSEGAVLINIYTNA